jgi:predicted DNA repair protein MutK
MPSSLFALLDDIATILDDVALMTKVAAKKTAGVLGDDLALNAQQVAGVNPERELPVVLAVAKGSAINKAILVPAALAISALVPSAIVPLLMLGGAYLCYEGVEKLAHKLLHSEGEDDAHHAELVQALADPAVDPVALERDKIKGAVRTDFILSAEIIVISLGTVASAGFIQRLVVLVGISVIMTIGVYGLVAGIVKLDDAGLYLRGRAGAVPRAVGRGLIAAAPYLMKSLSVAGTVAMFMVGGGILLHGLPALHHAVEHFGERVAGLPGASALVSILSPILLGVLAGALVLLAVSAAQLLWRSVKGTPKATKPRISE